MTKEIKGSLIVVEGLDGSGKETQTKKLVERLTADGMKVKKIEFPRYNSESSALIKMYLRGDFGDKAADVSPYVASTFYAVDRYASYKQDWEKFYIEGGIVIADRYTTSNFVHQAGKIGDRQEREKFLNWLCDFEYNLYKLPVPDVVFFLDVPPEYNERLMADRNNKFTGAQEKDIHERDVDHLREAYASATDIVRRFNWTRIQCVKDDKLRSIEDINDEVYNAVLGIDAVREFQK